MRFNNYYDYNLLLDEEDQKLLTQHDNQSAYDVDIDDTALQHLEIKRKLSELLTSAVNPTIVPQCNSQSDYVQSESIHSKCFS